jgi:hypothetical protein
LRFTGQLTGNRRHDLFVSHWAVSRKSGRRNVGSDWFGLDRISKKAQSGRAVGVPINRDAIAFEISLNSPAMEGW